MFKTEHKSLRVKAGKNRYFAKAFNEVTTTKKAQVFRHISVLLFSIETPLHFLFFSFHFRTLALSYTGRLVGTYYLIRTICHHL